MDLKTYLRGRTQSELAERLGVTQGAVSHWVTGRARVPAEMARAIERITGGEVTRVDLRPDLFDDVDSERDMAPTQ